MIHIKPPSIPARARHRLLSSLHATVLTTLLAVAMASKADEGPQPRLPTVEIGAGMHRIQAEVAQTPQQQMTGMMWRKQMGSYEGMLFVIDEPEKRCFWMRNTLIPLAIAFIADDGTIVNVAEMQARSEQSHCSARPVRFALEMNQGWFERRGIKAGFKLRGPMFKP